MSARETANLRWVGSCEPRALTAELSPAQPMDGDALLRAPTPSFGAVGIHGISSEEPWHRITSDYGAKSRWVPGPTAIQGG